MGRLLSFFLRHRNPVSLLLTVFLSLWMISLDTPQKVVVARAFTTTVFYPVQFLVHQVRKVRNIWGENKHLRKRTMQLRLENSQLLEKTLENDRLRQLLHFKERTRSPLIPAEVVGHNPGRHITSFVLNVGAKEGVARNMPVVGIDGVVGKIITVSQHSSLVQLLSDPNSRLGVMTRRSRVSGIMESEEGIRFKMRTQEHADLRVGDTLITSGLGGVFPKGLAVGKVRGSKMGKHGIYREHYIQLDVDFDYVEEVFVLKRVALWKSDTNPVYVSPEEERSER